MKYDFTSMIDRRGMDASAVDNVGKKVWGAEPDAPREGFDFIPMWVADMSFPTCPAVTEAIIQRVQHPIFGYFSPSEEYYRSILDWQTERNGYSDLKKEYIGFENGVHGGVTSAVEILSKPGDKILLHSPVYLGFRSDVEGLGRTSVYSPLVRDEEGIWRMDYADMDRKLKENDIHLAIFCSPHNPSGRVWERWELEKAMEVYETNDCMVISDEIWADLVLPGHQHTPSLMVNDWAREHVVAFTAPTKTFNLAGLVGSYHIVYNQSLRERLCGHGERTHYNSMNVLTMHAQIGGYSQEGREWLDELRQVLQGNADYALEHIHRCYPLVEVARPQGTYMLFLDLTEYCRRTGRSLDEVIRAGWAVGVGWQDGRPFQGPCHIRMNLALPFERVKEAFARLDEYVFTD